MAQINEHTTLEHCADYCDQKAEGANAHEFCGTHRLLAAVLMKHVNRDTATEILHEIATRGGLHGMAGVCGAQDSYEDLGITEYDQDWKLSE